MKTIPRLAIRPALRRLTARAPLFLLLLTATSCSNVYYRTMESFGLEKRDILVNRVASARDAQVNAKDEFASALDQFRSVVAVDGGDLEQKYNGIRRAYEQSESRARAVSNRIGSVQRVAEDLFAEWERELDDYSDPGLRRSSEGLLRDTRAQYGELIGAMRRAEEAMQPVLTLFQDQVLVLRHNLNARAIGALENELDSIERATTELIQEMERSIEEAGRFIAAMA